MIRANRHLIRLSDYEAAPPIDGVIRERGLKELARLSNNENPYGPLPSVLPAINAALVEVNRYPDDCAPTLRRAIANRHLLDSEWIAIGCGSLDLLQQLIIATVGPGDEVVFGWPSFAEYPRLTSIFGGTPVPVALSDWRFDVIAMAERVTERTQVIIVCNPNTPTGTLLTQNEIKDLIERLPSDRLVILDEAYGEYAPEAGKPDGVRLAYEHDNVATLRTFSKAYGLAGLRVGYAVAHPSIIELLYKVHLTFAVNRVAQAAALASLDPVVDAELARRVKLNAGERTRLRDGLKELGIAVPDSETNFLFVPTVGSAGLLVDWLEGQRVLVRAVSQGALRITVGTRSENERLLSALAQAPFAIDTQD